MNQNKNLLCLKWDEFDSFVVNGLSNLYQKDDLSDTTLFCDGRSFKAHKVVLSMWSNYFREIFNATTHAHPVVVLRETTSSDLELILRFIYQGQLFVPFEDTERFLKTAEYFQVAGLRDMRVHLSNEHSSTTTRPNNNNNSNGKGVGITPMVQQFIPTTSYAHSSIDGIPIHLVENSTSPSPPRLETNNNPMNNSISIVANNPLGQSQFSTANIIKAIPIPSRQSSGRMNPLLVSPTNNGSRQTGQELLYSTQPILIVHNSNQQSPSSKPNEYHENRITEHNRPPEQVLVMERVGNGHSNPMELKKVTSVHSNSGIGINDGNYNHNSHGQQQQEEEVLGLAYLHDSNSSSRTSQSHIIQEAAVAAGVGVEDSGIVQLHRDPYVSNDSFTNSSGKETKPNNNNSSAATSQQTPSTPVYAVKRVPPTTSTASSSEPSTAHVPNSSSFKTKAKRRSRMQSQQQTNASAELVNCPKCDKIVKKTSLKVHMTRTHLEEGKVLTCPICNKQISSKGVYYKHMYGHRQKATDVKHTIKQSSSTTAKSKESRT